MSDLFFTDKEIDVARQLMFHYGYTNGYQAGDFNTRLIQAMEKADHINIEKLLIAFPEFRRPVTVLRLQGVGALSSLVEALTSYRAEQHKEREN